MQFLLQFVLHALTGEERPQAIDKVIQHRDPLGHVEDLIDGAGQLSAMLQSQLPVAFALEQSARNTWRGGYSR